MAGLALLADARPDAWAGFADLVDTAWADPSLPPGTLELCRLRMGQLLGSDRLGDVRIGELPDGFEGRVDRLRQWPTDPDLPEAQRLALSACEQFLMDAHDLDDAAAATIVGEVGDAGYAVLTVGLGLAEALVRAAAVLDVAPGRRRVASLRELADA